MRKLATLSFALLIGCTGIAIAELPAPPDTSEMNEKFDFVMVAQVCYADGECYGPTRSLPYDTIEACTADGDLIAELVNQEAERRGGLVSGDIGCFSVDGQGTNRV